MPRSADTQGFVLNQTMLRVRDPEASVAFYRDVLGMDLIAQLDFPPMKFSLYFMAYLEDGEVVPDDPAEKAKFIFSRETTLELTHNWGTESDPDFAGYHCGNDEPRGFGHLGISVPDVAQACARFEKLGVRFIKRMDEGAMKTIAFIADPDGYWVEILSPNGMAGAIQFAQDLAKD